MTTHTPPKVLDDGTAVEVLDDDPIEVNGETWLTLLPVESLHEGDERLWEFSTTTGRIVQTME
jgi:hypothetical protein